MAYVMEVLDVIVLVIKMISVLVLIIGLVICFKKLLWSSLSGKERQEKGFQLQRAKNELGWFILLGLEILIIGDIIETVISPSFADIGRLAAIVAIRTVISFFLNKEIRETDQILEKTQKDGGAAEG